MEFFSPDHLIHLLHVYGYAVLAAVIGFESIGLPLPGESLLIAAAVIAGTTYQLAIIPVVLSAAIGAIVGQAVGYWIGRKFGFRLLSRYGRHIGLTDGRLAYGRALFRRHGIQVIIIARFVAILRVIAALLAGANHMPWPRFMVANVLGSVAWAALYGFGAYGLGHEAKRLAGPAAVVVGLVAIAALIAGGLYIQRSFRSANI